jgi:hypothetical protein
MMLEHSNKNQLFIIGRAILIFSCICPYTSIWAFAKWPPYGFFYSIASSWLCMAGFIAGLVMIWLSSRKVGSKILITVLSFCAAGFFLLILAISILLVPGVGAPH